MNEWNSLFFLNEADDDEEKEKNKDEKEDKKKENKDEKKPKKDDDKEEDDEYNDLIDDKDSKDDDIELDEEKDTDSSSDDEYNDLMDSDTPSEDEDDLDEDFMKDDNTDSEDGGEYNTLVAVVKTDGDTDTEDSNVYEKAAKVAYVYTVIANNLKHIHLNACGNKFQEIHTMCDEYYHHFSYQSDFYYELAAESPFVTIDNPTRAKEHCEDIAVEMEKDYNFRKALETICSNLSSALKYLDELREAASSTRPDIQSKVDDELSYINKQTKYFIRKKLCGEDNSCEESYNELL